MMIVAALLNRLPLYRAWVVVLLIVIPPPVLLLKVPTLIMPLPFIADTFPITILPALFTVPLLVKPLPAEPLMVRLPVALMVSDAPPAMLIDFATAEVA